MEGFTPPLRAGHGPPRRPVTAYRQPVSTELRAVLRAPRLASQHRLRGHHLLGGFLNYFVTGATGFIGRHLVAELLKRDGTIYALVREGSRGKLDALAQRLGRSRGEDRARGGRPLEGRARHRGLRPADRPSLPPGGRLRHRGRRGGIGARERRGHPARDRVRERARGRALPPHQLDRGGRQLRGHLPGGHVRRGAEAAPPLPPHQVRVGAARARGRRDEDAGVPAGHRGRPLGDRRDGQDRRSLLLLQAAPEAPPRAAGVVPARRARGRADEHRAGGLRRARDGPHLAPAGRATCPGTRSTW